MSSSLHGRNYTVFRLMLIEARREAGLTQTNVANQLGRPQSFVSKYEGGERRLDFTEFVELSTILKLDIENFIAAYRAKISAPVRHPRKKKAQAI